MPTEKRNPGALAGATGARDFAKAGQAGEREHSPTKGPKATAYRAQKAWHARNPMAAWAHAALRSALKKGLIERQPCEVCGDLDVDGHHEDHERPMAVRWLCRKHNQRLHASQRRAVLVAVAEEVRA